METNQQTAFTNDPATTFRMRVEHLREKLFIPGLSLSVLHRQHILIEEEKRKENEGKPAGEILKISSEVIYNGDFVPQSRVYKKLGK